MSVYSPDGPRVETKGASNTECIVFVHTHDRGPKNPSQSFDLSPYITGVSTSQHVMGGGSASIDLPAVDHIEDIIAAGDIVNIYFNTNRSSENMYNLGRVRTFFGYVTSVSKSVSVGAEGEKVTTYGISCKDFSKCVRDTQIYNNPHLASQSRGSKEDVIRSDLSTNLGGIALLHQGIALQGTPRQIIVQNLMRFLGFGGQWALPLSYDEKLPGKSSWTFKVDEGGKGSVISSLQAITVEILRGKSNTDEALRKKYIDAIVALSKQSIKKKKTISALWDNVADSGVSPKIKETIEELKGKFKNLAYKLVPPKDKDQESHINNTFFKIKGVNQKKMSSSILGTENSTEVTLQEQGLWKDIHTVTARVINEIQGVSKDTLNNAPDSFPKANQYAQAFDSPENNRKVKTMFNIMCLDYMENVKGFWANLAVLNTLGSLYSALEVGANSSMNELIFDLRPSPEFEAKEKDGLGVPLKGAIPMVPAVVLRRKPFTNYKVPGAKEDIGKADVSEHLVVGGYQSGAGNAGFDQLVVNSGGALGVGGATAIDATSMGSNMTQRNAAVNLLLKNSGANDALQGKFETVKLKRVSPPTKKKSAKLASDNEVLNRWAKKIEEIAERAVKEGVNNNKALVELFGAALSPTVTEDWIYDIQLTGTNVSTQLAKAALTSTVTLPRPIFRSPDNNRILKELDMSRTQYVLGVLASVDDNSNSTSKFFALEAPEGQGMAYSGYTAKDIGSGKVTGITKSKKKIKRVAIAPGSDIKSIAEEFKSRAAIVEKENKETEDVNDIDWHVLDYMSIFPTDIFSENYTRGDFGVVNFLEYFGKTIGGLEAQRLFLGVIMPIVTPISVYRFGVRVFSQTTDFVQSLLTGNSEHLFEKNILLRWAVCQDIWNQHNHELLGGSMTLRGMPGLRPGYRIDRLDTNMSFYVEQVAHSWTYPGRLETQVSVSHGQPMNLENALDYYRPSSGGLPHKSERQNLGKIFKVSEFERGGTDVKLSTPGTFTGSDGVGRQLNVKSRKKNPKDDLPSKKGK